MVFEIGFGDCYPTSPLFDIEFFQRKVGDNAWSSELRVLPCVEGITRFLQSKRNDDKFNYDEFIRDAYEIQELRGWLYERDGNKVTTLEENDKLHYEKRLPYLKDIFKIFAKKYGLYVSED